MAGVHQSPDGVMTPTGQLKPNSHHETIPVGECVDAREFKRVKTAADMRADRSSTHIRTCSRMRMGVLLLSALISAAVLTLLNSRASTHFPTGIVS